MVIKPEAKCTFHPDTILLSCI